MQPWPGFIFRRLPSFPQAGIDAALPFGAMLEQQRIRAAMEERAFGLPSTVPAPALSSAFRHTAGIDGMTGR
jgi:hypothetical protein